MARSSASNPQIRILQGISGARRAYGYVVVIDVLRAFTTACYAVSQGSRGILPLATLAAAFELRRRHRNWILMGERNGIKVAGFDLGNSPDEIEAFGSFSGRMIIHATSNGTRGIAAVGDAETVVTGSFVNAKAIAGHIHAQSPCHVDLVCMGTSSGPAVEDDLCATYLASLIREESVDMGDIRRKIYRHPSIRRFLTNDQDQYPSKDLQRCLSADRFDFVLCREPYQDSHYILRPMMQGVARK